MCECGHADHEHDTRKFGRPCLRNANGAHYCWAFRPVDEPADAATPLPESRQSAASVAAFLHRVAAEILDDRHEIRPTKVIVVMLNRLGSDATWGPEGFSEQDERDAMREIERSLENAGRYHATKAWNAAHPGEPQTYMPAPGARQRRLHHERVDARMKAVHKEAFPFACECKKRFKTDAGLRQHKPYCDYTCCPTCGGRPARWSSDYAHEGRWVVLVYQRECADGHQWETRRRRQPAKKRRTADA